MISAGWSARTAAAGQSGDSAATSSCHQWSRPGCPRHVGCLPPAGATITCFTVGEAATASSAVRFIGTTCPRR